MIAWFVASHLISRFVGGGLMKLFLGNLMGDLKAVVAFLKAHSIWLTVSLVLASCWGVDHVISHRHAAKVESQLAKCAEKQRKLEQQSKVQQVEVAKVVDHYITVEKPVVRERVRQIESAPLPGNCKTPQAVMEAGV